MRTLVRPFPEQALALAGVAQAAWLVSQVARTGEAEPEALGASIESLFVFNPESTESVFGGINGVRTGIAALSDLLGRNLTPHQQDQLRYVMGMLYLERKLAGRADLLEIIRQRLEHTRRQAEHFTDSIGQILPGIAGIYQDTLSTFRFRIQVTGDPRILESRASAERIRAILLAGVRAAMLWHQVGGRRWKLLYQRRALIAALGELRGRQ